MVRGAPPHPSQAQPWPLLTAAPLRSPRKSSGLGAGSAGPVLRPCTPWDPNPTLGGNAAAAAAPPSAAGPAAACWKDPAPRDVGEWGAAGVLWDSGRPGSPAGGSHHPTQGTGARAWSRRALCFLPAPGSSLRPRSHSWAVRARDTRASGSPAGRARAGSWAGCCPGPMRPHWLGQGGRGGRVSHRPWGPRGQSLPLGSVWFLGAPHPTPRLPGPAPSWADHRFSANQRAFQSNTSVSG